MCLVLLPVIREPTVDFMEKVRIHYGQSYDFYRQVRADSLKADPY